MDLIVWEWIELSVRWLHVIAGIAWIGSSFYFMHLDASIRHSEALPRGASGETWQVHSGGFYHMVKFLVAPNSAPERMTWFKWEAYTTFISGFTLLIIVYYLGAELYLIDNYVLEISVHVAIIISVTSLFLSWILYDQLCRSRLASSRLWLTIIGFFLLTVATWGFTQTFSARGAFMQIGAIIGSIMVANVWRIVIPNQKIIVAELRAGREPNQELGKEAKLRSTHNNYLTLPVLFIMISNHYPLAYATEWNWVILMLMVIVGAVIRHFFNMRHQNGPNSYWCWVVATIGICVAVWLSSISPYKKTEAATLIPTHDEKVSIDEIMEIVSSRCSMCHASTPVWVGLAAAPKGILLDTKERVRANAKQIYINAYLSGAMPPSNVAFMERSERETIAQWYKTISDGAE